MSRTERLVLGALAACSLVFRALAFFRYRFDSDEPQHLHVAWGWTAGLVQYRDLFDNHAPLFHILTAPLLSLVGERPDVLLFMRVPMLPLFAIVLIATYLVGRRLYSQRVALWATLLLSLFPPFFTKSLEYRTDNLWNAVWALVLIVLVTVRPTLLRAFINGLLLGIAACVSLKTTLLFFTVASAALISAFMLHDRTVKRVLQATAVSLLGFAIVPSIVAAYFVRLGAWPNLLYCVFEFNEKLTQTRTNVWLPRLAYPFLFAAVLYSAWRRKGRVVDEETRWRFFFGVSFGMFTITLLSFWILISPRDFLPMMPVAMIFIASELERGRKPLAWLTAMSILFAVATVNETRGFHNGTREHITMMNQVLRLTRPGEPLMDLKGETIFRRRPYYYIFEFITRAQMEHGLIPDTIERDVVAARCHVAQADGPFFPPRGKAFLHDHFLDVGRLRASGQWIALDGTFSIGVPGSYVVVDAHGEAKGTLDGTPYAGARELAAGPHRFERGAPGGRVAIFWAPAYARGFTPFRFQDRDF